MVMGDIQEEEAHIPGDEHRMSRSEPTTLIFCSVWDERRYWCPFGRSFRIGAASTAAQCLIHPKYSCNLILIIRNTKYTVFEDEVKVVISRAE